MYMTIVDKVYSDWSSIGRLGHGGIAYLLHSWACVLSMHTWHMLEFKQYRAAAGAIPADARHSEVESFNIWASKLAFGLIFNSYRDDVHPNNNRHGRRQCNQQEPAADDEGDEDDEDEAEADYPNDHILQTTVRRPEFVAESAAKTQCSTVVSALLPTLMVLIVSMVAVIHLRVHEERSRGAILRI